MKIFVVIAYHDEPEDIYLSLLKSINSQKEIDFSDFHFIFSRSDGIFKFPCLDEFKNIKDNSTFVSHKYSLQGPGWSRQQGIDIAQSFTESAEDFVIMCDIDDCWVNEYSLSTLYLYVDKNKDKDGILFVPQRWRKSTNTLHEPNLDTYTPHVEPWSRCMNLKFLKDNQIHFPTTFLYGEDVWFASCYYAMGPKEVLVKEPIYRYTIPENSTANAMWKLLAYDRLNQMENYRNEFNDWCKDKRGLNKTFYFYNLFYMIRQCECEVSLEGIDEQTTSLPSFKAQIKKEITDYYPLEILELMQWDPKVSFTTENILEHEDE